MKSTFCLLIALHFIGQTFSEDILGESFQQLAYDICRHGNYNVTFHNYTPFTYIIKEDSLCTGDVKILNYVQSSSDHFQRRMLIRETFGSMKYIEGDPVTLMFVLGDPRDKKTQKLIREESDNYRDIVQGDFHDTYRNLTLKHIVALHWIHHFCPQAKIISKSDDDTFVNNFLLHSYIEPYLSVSSPFLLGQISSQEAPIRTPRFKWTVDERMYPGSMYPPYMKGFGYIISQSAVRPLLVCSYYNNFLYIDDVFITGIVARSANVTLIQFDRPFSIGGFNNVDGSSEVVNHIFLVGNNNVNADLWRDVWKKILFLAF